MSGFTAAPAPWHSSPPSQPENPEPKDEPADPEKGTAPPPAPEKSDHPRQ